MKRLRQLPSLYFICMVLLLFSCSDDGYINKSDSLIVILKADDYGDAAATPNWNRFIETLVKDSICAGIGITSIKMQNQLLQPTIKISEYKQSNGFPVVEFWNHGYDHFESKTDKTREFYNTNYEYQYSHLQKVQRFFKDSLHLISHSFGAPYNQSSIITESAIDNIPELQIMMSYDKTEHHFSWKDPKHKGIHSRDKRLILSVDYLSMADVDMEGMRKYIENDLRKPYIMIQMHPCYWKEAGFQKFDEIIKFYKTNYHAKFMTPYQYYQFTHNVVTENNIVP